MSSSNTLTKTAAGSPPPLTLQTASLWASGDTSVFSGTGGPQGYDPFFNQFADVITSAGLDGTPFNGQLFNVEAGDEVVFVVAVQNRTAASAYDVKLLDTMPAGFAIPPEGSGLYVMDGTGQGLNFTGDLFSSGGLTITDPVAAYDPSSGTNVALVTFTLQATNALAVPTATLQNTAQLVSYAATSGGPNLLPSTIATSTPVTTTGIQVAIVADAPVVTLTSGAQTSYDVTVTLSEGTVRDLRIDEILPHLAGSWLQLASAQIISVGANLQTSSAPVIGSDGSVAFGTVTNTPDHVVNAADQIVVRLTVAGAGSAAGQGTLQTVVSAIDPNTTAGRWSQTVSNSLWLAAPDTPPTISGTGGNQNATDTMTIRPLVALSLADPVIGRIDTLTIHLSDRLLGTLSGTGLTVNGSGDYVLSGTAAQLQAAAQALDFSTGPGRSGTEQLSLRLDDGNGGVATDANTSITVAFAAPAAAFIQHFATSPVGSVVTATASGGSTVAAVETYSGPVDYLQTQFIYDGTDALAIRAESPNIFIKNVAGSTAVQLLSGQNVVDAGHGSNFILGGTGTDVFFLDARQSQDTWDTLVGFHPGDIATLWGFKDGVSRYWWDDSAGAAGYTGRTLRADLTGSGHIDASITFAGTVAADTNRYALTTGSIAGNDYMTIFSL